MSGELKADSLDSLQQTAWHALELRRVLDDLQVHESGVTPEEAAGRLRELSDIHYTEKNP